MLPQRIGNEGTHFNTLPGAAPGHRLDEDLDIATPEFGHYLLDVVNLMKTRLLGGFPGRSRTEDAKLVAHRQSTR
jgi:hypothetical protein